MNNVEKFEEFMLNLRILFVRSSSSQSHLMSDSITEVGFTRLYSYLEDDPLITGLLSMRTR